MPKFPCHQCQTNIDAADSMAGMAAECPACGAPIVVPTARRKGAPNNSVTWIVVVVAGVVLFGGYLIHHLAKLPSEPAKPQAAEKPVTIIAEPVKEPADDRPPEKKQVVAATPPQKKVATKKPPGPQPIMRGRLLAPHEVPKRPAKRFHVEVRKRDAESFGHSSKQQPAQHTVLADNVDNQSFQSFYHIQQSSQGTVYKAKYSGRPKGGKGFDYIMLPSSKRVRFNGHRTRWDDHQPHLSEIFLVIPWIIHETSGREYSRYLYEDKKRAPQTIEIEFHHHRGRLYQLSVPNLAPIELSGDGMASLTRGLRLRWDGQPLDPEEVIHFSIREIHPKGTPRDKSRSRRDLNLELNGACEPGATELVLDPQFFRTNFAGCERVQVSANRVRSHKVKGGGPSGMAYVTVAHATQSIELPIQP